MLPESVCTSSELLQPSISHPSLSTHIFWHESSSADSARGKRTWRWRVVEPDDGDALMLRRGLVAAELLSWVLKSRSGSCQTHVFPAVRADWQAVRSSLFSPKPVSGSAAWGRGPALQAPPTEVSRRMALKTHLTVHGAATHNQVKMPPSYFRKMTEVVNWCEARRLPHL